MLSADDRAIQASIVSHVQQLMQANEELSSVLQFLFFSIDTRALKSREKIFDFTPSCTQC